MLQHIGQVDPFRTFKEPISDMQGLQRTTPPLYFLFVHNLTYPHFRLIYLVNRFITIRRTFQK